MRKSERFALADLEETNKRDVKCLWGLMLADGGQMQATMDSLQHLTVVAGWQLGGKQGPQSCTHEEMNSANNLWAWKKIEP